MAIETDVVVIGGGPGGYPAAIRAAQLGARAVLIEKDQVGGTCLNRGCIPSKALLDAAERYTALTADADWGIEVGNVGFDWSKILARKNKVVQQLRGGTEGLVKANGITLLRGTGSFVDPRRVRVALGEGGVEEVTATKAVVIATGSAEARPPIPGLDLPGVFGSTQGLELAELPKSVIIVGGSAVGVEFASVFQAFGVRVTVVEMLPSLIPQLDAEAGKELARQFQKRDITVLTGARVDRVAQTDDGMSIDVTGPSGAQSLSAERIMVAIGRVPYTDGLGIERLGLEMNKRYVKVDDRMQTSVPGVYAVGDVVGGGLAHVASAQGEVAVENALGHESSMDGRAIPFVVYSFPQVAMVGQSEEQARAAGVAIKVGRFPLAAGSKAIVDGTPEGFVKVVADEKYEQVLGVTIVGSHATDLIVECGLAITLESTIEDIAQTIHPHPTLSEPIREAALDVEQRAIHIMKRRRA